MKKVLILEDNAEVLKCLSEIIGNISVKTTVYAFDNVKDAYECALEKTIDLFLVDVILNSKRPGDSSGLRFVENIRQVGRYGLVPVIIVTSLGDERLYSYEKLHCYGFIEKPFRNERVMQLAEEALRCSETEHRTKTLFFRQDGIILAVEREEIVYAESINHVLNIHTSREDVMHIHYETIKKFLEEADSNDFVQCSRNTVVNMRFVQNIDLTNRVISFKNGLGRAEIGIMYKNRMKELMS